MLCPSALLNSSCYGMWDSIDGRFQTEISIWNGRYVITKEPRTPDAALRSAAPGCVHIYIVIEPSSIATTYQAAREHSPSTLAFLHSIFLYRAAVGPSVAVYNARLDN